jgi:hypothetical protein
MSDDTLAPGETPKRPNRFRKATKNTVAVDVAR